MQVFGGCCGTTPEYIALLRRELEGRTVRQVPRAVPAAVCSGTQVVPIDRVRVIGERINPTGKKLMKEALRRGTWTICWARPGPDGGRGGHPGCERGPAGDRRGGYDGPHSEGSPGGDGRPLQLDSTDPKVLERALRVYCGKAIVNSVNGEEESLSTILPLVKKYGAAVVGLTLDQGVSPKARRPGWEVARRILERALAPGRPPGGCVHRLPDTHRLRRAGGAAQTLTALRRVKEELGLKTVLGVSNISFGLLYLGPW